MLYGPASNVWSSEEFSILLEFVHLIGRSMYTSAVNTTSDAHLGARNSQEFNIPNVMSIGFYVPPVPARRRGRVSIIL